MQTNNRSMQIITRANERIQIDRQLTVTVLEVFDNEVTLEIAGPDGDVRRVTLSCATGVADDPVDANCELACC